MECMCCLPVQTVGYEVVTLYEALTVQVDCAIKREIFLSSVEEELFHGWTGHQGYPFITLGALERVPDLLDGAALGRFNQLVLERETSVPFVGVCGGREHDLTLNACILVSCAARDAVQALFVDLVGNLSCRWSTAHALKSKLPVISARDLDPEDSVLKAIA